MKKFAKRIYPIAVLVMLVLTISMLSSGSVYALGKSVTVKPSGKKNGADVGRITKALKKYKTVKLKKGKTYYLPSPIHIKSNRTIDATGATIICTKSIFVPDLKKAGYANIKNVTIRGGLWKSKKSTGYKGTSFCFVHASGITLENMTIEHTNYNGHAIELVACKDVKISGVTISPRGTPGTSMESMLQIDIATSKTYPRLKKAKLSNGATCHNVIVKNCDITGNRAIASGYSYDYLQNVHTNIQLLNNKFYSKRGEGISFINAKNVVIKGNTVISYSTKLSEIKSTGLHYLIAGNIKNTSIRCENNVVKGGKHAIRVYSKGSYKLTNVKITGNTCYCRAGADSAIQAADKGIDSLSMSGNRTYKW